MLDEKTLEQQDEEKEYQNNFKPREVKLKDDYPFIIIISFLFYVLK